MASNLRGTLITPDQAGTLALLQVALDAAVPLWASVIREWAFEERQRRAQTAAQMIAEHGDNILYKSPKRGETAKAFNALAEAVAILSFSPGGVTIFERHYENT